jgi:hypothetical protein
LSIRDFDFSTKQILLGNILLIICCAFYLVWWLLAFRPNGNAHNVKTGLLLIPAIIAGLIAVVFAVKGISSASIETVLFPKGILLWGGIAVYLILLVVTYLFFKRPVTTELFLIIGWAVMILSEINVLYGLGRFSYSHVIVFIIVIGVATLISLVCYVLYYNLGGLAGYLDGMVPLLLAALVTAIISIAMIFD